MIQKQLHHRNTLHRNIEYGLVVYCKGDLTVNSTPMAHISDSIPGENTKGYEIVLLYFVHHSTDTSRRLDPRPKWFAQSHVFSSDSIHISELRYTLSNIVSTFWRQMKKMNSNSKKQARALIKYL